jgi:hypothetical protein
MEVRFPMEPPDPTWADANPDWHNVPPGDPRWRGQKDDKTGNLAPPPSLPPRGTVYGKLTVYGTADIDTAPMREYLVKGLICADEISLWVGPPKCGKSFLLMGIAYKLSLGLTVFGRRVKQTPTLYLAAEGEGGIGNRIKALRKRYGPSEHFFWSAQQIDLLRGSGHLEDAKKATEAVGARLIVVDTLNRVLAGGDENSPQDMGLLITNLTDLRNHTHAHVAGIHHGTKASNGSSPRGHSSLTGADDVLVEVTKHDDGSRSAVVAHSKDDADGGRMAFLLQQVDLGADDDGDLISTLVFEEAEAQSAAAGSKPRLTGNDAIGMRCLMRAMTADAILTPVGEGQPERLAVHIEDWRKRFYNGGMPGVDQNTRKTAFSRVRTNLISKGAVQALGDLVWPTA